MQSRTFRPVIVVSFLAMAGAPQALAVEAEAVGERLKTLLREQQQLEFTYDDARMSGGDVVLEGVNLKTLDEDESFPLGELVLQDVSELDDGAYHVDTITIDRFEHQEDDITITGSDMQITGLVLPSPDTQDPFGDAMRYDRIEMAQLDVEDEEDGPLASVQNAYTTMSQEDGALRSDGGVESFDANLAAIVDGDKAETMLQDLGYTEISGTVYFDALWDPADGRMTISQYETMVEDAGTLTVMLDISGYTPEFMETIQQLSQQAQDGEDSSNGMALLGLLQQLNFHGLSIRFDDDSLVQKVLDYRAEQQNSEPAEIAAQTQTAISEQISPFVGEAFAANVANAVETFLEDPQNLVISANPGSPMPFAMLMGAAMGAPEMLIEQIGLTVEANQ